VAEVEKLTRAANGDLELTISENGKPVGIYVGPKRFISRCIKRFTRTTTGGER
jgi:uncharacterized protein YuzE